MLRKSFRDFDEFAESIAGIEGRFVPTAPSAADWWVQGTQANRVSVQVLQVGGCATFAGTGQHDRIAVGLPMTDARRMCIDATALREDCYILMQGPQPFIFTGTGPTQWAGITLPSDHPILDPSTLQILGATDSVRTRTQLEYLVYFRGLVNRALSLDPTVNFATPIAAAALDQDISLAVARVLQMSCEDRDIRREYLRAHHARAIARCLELMKASRGQMQFIEDLVHAAQVSERTLRTLFQAYFGVSPMRLLKAKQLWEVRAALLNRQSGEGVIQIAGRFGFWDASLFAHNYKALFGELPSETLQSPVNASRRDASLSWLIFAARTFRAQAGTSGDKRRR